MSIVLVHLALWAFLLPALLFTLIVVLGQRVRKRALMELDASGAVEDPPREA